mmetsp:Transcript_35883/g.47206  ORF Transcript_35883/g.47206 Transcript_35883/m.47206 type:complete len:186 (-) Transcript_35883:194-751(-)
MHVSTHELRVLFDSETCLVCILVTRRPVVIPVLKGIRTLRSAHLNGLLCVEAGRGLVERALPMGGVIVLRQVLRAFPTVVALVTRGVVGVTDLFAILQVLFQIMVIVLHDALLLLAHFNDGSARAGDMERRFGLSILVLLVVSSDCPDYEGVVHCGLDHGWLICTSLETGNLRFFFGLADRTVVI